MKFFRQSALQKFVAFFFLASVSLFIVPKELIHEFYHHEDSHDLICMTGCDGHVSNEHQHCEVLQLATPPLYFQFSSFTFLSTDLFCVLDFKSSSSYHFSTSPFLFFRGPPVLV